MNHERSAGSAYHLAAVIALSAVLLFSGNVPAQSGTLPEGITRVATIEGITEYRLENGLRVLLFPDQTKQTITVNMTYLVGSRHENYGETGMAHLLEHLVFKGTPRHPNIPQELTAHGARPNGTTNPDRTNYFETFAATDENLNWALDLEADRMVNSFIAKKDLDSEFSVVRNELESGENNPLRVIFQRTIAAGFDWHNYGKSTIGARSDLENVPIDRLQAFYKKYYQPDNSVLLVAGKFDEAKTLGLVKKYFGPIPKPERKLEANYTVEPVQDGERSVTVRRVGDIQVLMAGYHVPPASHPETPAVDVFSTLLTDTPSGRLYKSLVEAKKATAVFEINFSFKEPSYLLFTAQVNKDLSIEAAREAMIETVEKAADSPPTKEEVDRAKTSMLKNFELILNDPNRVGLGMSEYVAQGDWRLFFLYRDRLEKVTPEDVAAAAKKYFKPSNRTIGMFVPTEKPDRAEVPNVTDDEIAVMVKDFKGKEAVAMGEAFDPSPANIESRVKRMQIGGLKVAFLNKENRGDSVVANMTLRFGDEKSLMNRGTAGEFVAAMLDRGTKNHTRQQINDEFDRLKARVSVGGSATSANVSIESTRQNLPAVLRLVGEILRQPIFPEGEFDKLKEQRITGIQSQMSDPQAIALRTISGHFNTRPKGHPLYSGTFEEDLNDIKATTVDDVKKFYKDFYGASTGELTVVGDFDAGQISALATELFGNWKSPSNYSRIVSNYTDIKPINKNIETPDKANALFIARMNLNMKNDNPDYPAVLIGNYMLGGGFLNSRLATRIRQKDGLSYGVGSQFQAPALDPSGVFLGFAIYAPENRDKLEAAFKDELNKMITAGFTAAEVGDAIKGWLQSQQLSRANDRELSRDINNYLYLGRTIEWDADLEKKVSELTPAKINAAMKKYIIPEKMTLVKAGDFAKSKAGGAEK